MILFLACTPPPAVSSTPLPSSGLPEDVPTETDVVETAQIEVHAEVELRRVTAYGSGGLVVDLAPVALPAGYGVLEEVEPAAWWVLAVGEAQQSCAKSDVVILESGAEFVWVVSETPGVMSEDRLDCLSGG